MPTDGKPQWDDALLADPHHVPDKAQRVERMFAAIADSYDLNNRVHSLGRDQSWRKRAVKMAELKGDEVVLDVACGTGDLSMAFEQAGVKQVIGLDFTYDMLTVADQKKNQANRMKMTYHCGDALRLPLADNSVDVVSIAFGIRNVSNPQTAMHEFRRVLKPGGRLIILEFGLPTNPILHWAYMTYFKYVMPRTAAWIARDRSGAYRYLPQSVSTFITRQAMLDMMQSTGFTRPISQSLTFGICLCYRGMKKSWGCRS